MLPLQFTPALPVAVETSVPLLVGFVLVCIGEVALGIAIWDRTPRAAVFGQLLLPFELFFWVGFALPAGPLLGIARTVMLAVA